jgi:hypothetical protein
MMGGGPTGHGLRTLPPRPAPEFKTPDQIEQEVIQYFALLNATLDLCGERPEPNETVIEALAMFRRGLSKNGYVFYQP